MKPDLEPIVKAVSYMETRLKERLSLDQIAESAGFSKFHFTRLFTKLTGQSPYDYFRARKLTQALLYMEETQSKIIDAALEYGYSSPEVFARACAAVYGESPKTIRQKIEEGGFNPIPALDPSYLWFLAREDFMEPRLVIKPSLTLAGVGYYTDDFYETLLFMKDQKLLPMSNPTKQPLYKLGFLEKQAKGYMNYVGIEADDNLLKNPMVFSKALPQMMYLVLPLVIDEGDLVHLYRYIFDTYLPQSPYEMIYPFAIELFQPALRTSELYIPVHMKEE